MVKKRLRELKRRSKNKLQKFIIAYFLRNHKEKYILKAMATASNPNVTSEGTNVLFPVKDTHKFFDKFYKELQELKDEAEKQMGTHLILRNVKRDLANFGFEETTARIVAELNCGGY